MVPPKKVSRKAFEEFAGERWNAMNDVLALSNLEDLSPIQRKPYLAYWYMSEVYNGGHWQYFCNRAEFDHQEVLNALQEIGAVEDARVLQTALSRLPADLTKPATVDQFLSGYEDVDLLDLDLAFGEYPNRIVDHLEKYLDQYESAFIEWTP